MKLRVHIPLLFALVLVSASSLWSQSVDSVLDPNRRFDQVTFLTAHNAFANTLDGWIYAQQALSIPDQLRMGVRGLMLDVHLGQGGAFEKQCRDVEETIQVVEDQCKTVARHQCTPVTVTKEVCGSVAGELCVNVPLVGRVCDPITNWVCKMVEVTENVCKDVDELVCTPVTVTKVVTKSVCDVVNFVPVGPFTPRLCHEQGEGKNCPMTRLAHPLQEPRRLSDGLRDVKNFLDGNPDAIVTIFLESYIKDSGPILKEFSDSGITPYMLELPERKDGNRGSWEKFQWPTIGEMRRSGKRAVVFSSEDNEGLPWNWGWVVESGYELNSTQDCSSRGSTTKNVKSPNVTLMTLNHFYPLTPGQPWSPLAPESSVTNSLPALLVRANLCLAQNGMLPNFVALDFAERGGGLALVNTLNALPR